MDSWFGNLSAIEAVQGILASLAFGMSVFAPGFLLTLFVRQLRSVSYWERVLWSTALGVPLAVALSVWGQRVLPRTAVNGIFLLLLVVAAGMAISRSRQPRSRADVMRGGDRSKAALAGWLALFAVYCLTETLDLQIGHRLYLSTLITDWSVRIAMVTGAVRSAVPPINPLSTLSSAGIGSAPHLRYYYFWYVFVAQIAGSLGLRAQPAFAAGCIWAGWGLLSACFLALKYLLGVRRAWTQACIVLLGLLMVLGLDILPTASMWLSRSHHPLMEMEWWRPDRTPSFLGAVLASPHHMAGFCSLLCGTLLLVMEIRAREGETLSKTGLALGESALLTALAALFFATAAGLSLFNTFCFALGLSLWAVDLLRRRAWGALGRLAAAGVLALLLAHGYLSELSTGSSAAHGFLSFAWRSDGFAASEMTRFLHLGTYGPVKGFLLRQPAVLLLDFAELAFYIFVLSAAIRQDLFQPGRLSAGRCVWWALLLGAGLPMFFLTSLATGGPNDLGFDAGFLFRLCLQLWAVEWVRTQWSGRREPKTPWQRIGFATAISLAALGIAGQIYQILSIRLYFPVVGSGLVHKQMDVLTQDHLAERLANIHSALNQMDRTLPPSRPDTEAVQFNPVGPLEAPEVYFNTHQIASWDSGCGTSFGGDYAHCAPVYASLLFLYGNTAEGALRSRAVNTAQDGAAARVATAADLARVCRDLKLRAVIADATDSIWAHPDSWVWTGQPLLVANSTVRVIGCPPGSWRP